MTSLNATVTSSHHRSDCIIKQDLSPDRIARLILNILFLENSKSVALILTWPSGGGRGGGGVLHCAKFSSYQR